MEIDEYVMMPVRKVFADWLERQMCAIQQSAPELTDELALRRAMDQVVSRGLVSVVSETMALDDADMVGRIEQLRSEIRETEGVGRGKA